MSVYKEASRIADEFLEEAAEYVDPNYFGVVRTNVRHLVEMTEDARSEGWSDGYNEGRYDGESDCA